MHRDHDLFEHGGIDGADQFANRGGGERRAAAGNGLVHDGKRVAHGAVASFGEQGERVVIDGEMFLLGDAAQLLDDVQKTHGMKAEVLAARTDGLGDVLGLRGGHHEDRPGRRLLEGLEQGIEGGIGDLVGFVEDENPIAVARRLGGCGGDQPAHFVDAAIAGSIDFDDIHGADGALANLAAGVTNAAGLRRPGDRRSGSSKPWPGCGQSWSFLYRDGR